VLARTTRRAARDAKGRRFRGETSSGALAIVTFALTQACRLAMLAPKRNAEGFDMGLISVLISVLVIVVVGAICFWAIEKFANDRRLANLLKLLVVLICLGAIVQRVLPLTY
jgi:hypothetical protein